MLLLLECEGELRSCFFVLEKEVVDVVRRFFEEEGDEGALGGGEGVCLEREEEGEAADLRGVPVSRVLFPRIIA